MLIYWNKSIDALKVANNWTQEQMSSFGVAACMIYCMTHLFQKKVQDLKPRDSCPGSPESLSCDAFVGVELQAHSRAWADVLLTWRNNSTEFGSFGSNDLNKVKSVARLAVIFKVSPVLCFFYLKQKETQVCWLSCSWVKSTDQLSRWQVWRRQNLVKGRLLCPGHGNAYRCCCQWCGRGGLVVTMLGHPCVLLLLFDKQKLVTHEKPIDS